jgi:hypothetical protein
LLTSMPLGSTSAPGSAPFRTAQAPRGFHRAR